MFDLENNQTIWVIIGGILLLTIGLGVYWVQTTSQANDTSLGSSVDIEIDEDEWTKGATENPKVTLVEYADLQCPACKSYQPIIQRLVNEVNGLRVVYRHFPLTQTHQNARKAAQAAEAAGIQGSFWEMHDKLFANQKEWAEVGNPKSIFIDYAEEIGLNVDQFKQDYSSKEVDENIKEDMRTASKFNLRGTPSFVLGGRVIEQLPRSYEEFVKKIERAKQNKSLTATSSEKQKQVHKHADIAIYVNGRKIDLSKDKYQSSEEDHKHKYSHHHDNVGNIVHQHKGDVTLAEHLKSLGMELTDECLKLDNGEEYCTNENKSLKMFVNEERKTDYDSYVFEDLDRILISYGPKVDSNLESQLESVTDEACIYSGECPERGEPPEESCVGGLGTKCEGETSTSTEK